MAEEHDLLREKAEQLLKEKKSVDLNIHTKNLENLVEELSIYHLELEHQNEELSRITQEKEKAAKKAQDLYNLSPISYVTIDGNKRIREVNQSFLNFLSRERNAVLGKALTDFIAPRSQDDFYFHFLELKKKPDDVLSTFLFFQGTNLSGAPELRECRIESRRVILGETDEWFVNISIVDETTEKELERKISFEREIWQKSFAYVSDAIFLVGPDYRILEVNRSAAALTGKEARDLVGELYYSVIHGKERFDNCPTCRAIADKKESNNEVYEEYLDKFLDIAVTPVIIESDFRFYTVIIRDISEKKIQEKSLIESEKRFRTIFNQSVAAMCITDENGIFEMVNDAYVNLYKYKREELIGKHFTIVVPDEHKEILTKAHDDFIRDGKEIRGEWEVRDKEGIRHSILADAAHIEGTDGRPKKVTFVVDISDLKKALQDLTDSKEQLTALNATKDKFFSIVAHDLKNPLSTILNFSKLIYSESMGFSDEEKMRFLGFIHEGAQSINRLLDNLLVWSRAQRGNIAFKPMKTSLNSLVEENIRLLDHSAIGKHISLIPDIIDDPEPEIDANMIDTVIRNLISNAIKFTRENGKIIIRIEKGETLQARVSVIDNGVGMDEEKVRSLFHIATNTSTKGTNEERGSGLGLLICKEFIDRHNGLIYAESRPGEGSKFIFEI